jgi:hypothetical protein
MKIWLKVILTLVFLGLVIWIANPSKIFLFWTELDLRIFGGVIALKFFSDIFKIGKWKLLARIADDQISFWESARSFYGGMALAVVTPFAIGELGRGALTNSSKRAELSGLAILDKAIDLMTVLAFTIAGLVLLAGRIEGVAISLVLYWSGLFAFVSFSRWIRQRWGAKNDLLNRLVTVAAQVKMSTILQTGTLSLIYFALFYLQAYFILLSFGLPFPREVIFYFPLITLSTILPITIGGLGIREGTAVFLLRQYGLPEAVIFGTFFMHFIVANVLAGLLGVIAYFLPREKKR